MDQSSAKRFFLRMMFWAVMIFPIKAETLFTSLGPDDSYTSCCGWGVVGPSDIAYSFTITGPTGYAFASAALALSQGIGTHNSVDIILAKDNSGQPGDPLESFHLENVLGPAGLENPLVTVTSSLHPNLLSGLRYWLIVSPSSDGNGVNWLTAFITPPSQRAVRLFDGGPWEVYNVDAFSGPGAFRIEGTAISSVPEPNSILLISLPLAIFFCRRQIIKTTSSEICRSSNS